MSYCEEDKKIGLGLMRSLIDVGFPTHQLTFEAFKAHREQLDAYLTKSTFYLLVFSRDYFSDKAKIEELSMMFTSRIHSPGKMSLPLLIDMDVSDLRLHSPLFASLMCRKFRPGDDKVIDVAKDVYKLTKNSKSVCVLLVKIDRTCRRSQNLMHPLEFFLKR